MTIKVLLKQSDSCKDLPLPYYATSQSAGMDLVAANDIEIIIKPGERKLIQTGITVEIPSGYEAQIRPRSGLALKHGITVLNSPGTIDSDYRGEIGVILINLGQDNFVIKRGDRIAQMVIAAAPQAKLQLEIELSESERGDGGFGSTGIKSQ